jgi:hypothetical protein
MTLRQTKPGHCNNCQVDARPLWPLRTRHCSPRLAIYLRAAVDDWRSHYGNSEHKTFEMRKQELKNDAEERMKTILTTVCIFGCF